MRVLVIGGGGYIGAHMSRLLAQTGHEVVVLDNLSTGHRAAVKWGILEHASMSDADRLRTLLDTCRFDAVMHFAAASLVGESVADPLKYYRNNVADVVTLLETMRWAGVFRLIFSSTAAVFGVPQQDLIDEHHPLRPINPYGVSKLAVERMLADCSAAYGMRAAALRYFNAAGAEAEFGIGESHSPETHLIPRLLRKAAGEDIDVQIFGNDYPTADGTCVRDYIHVSDLCQAHLLALEFLGSNEGFHAFNLGNGKGYSVKQVVSAAESVIGRSLGIKATTRRPGDPARLVASSDKACSQLGWRPQQASLEQIVESAWRWHQRPAY
ncbi:MAG: UDP-glucose 4-epimerase GalE [Nevskia sp.]|nr:UDP-glucose 4-epimerase GalE [Nevskia sp.]